MKTATITEAKNGLSALIDRVRSGESVLLLDRGVPVARLEPVTRYRDAAGRLARLERAGFLRVSMEAPGNDLRKAPPPLPEGVSAVDLLLEERRESR